MWWIRCQGFRKSDRFLLWVDTSDIFYFWGIKDSGNAFRQNINFLICPWYCWQVGKIVVFRIVWNGFQIFGTLIMGDSYTTDFAGACKGYPLGTADDTIIRQLIAGDSAVIFDQTGNGNGILLRCWNIIQG